MQNTVERSGLELTKLSGLYGVVSQEKVVILFQTVDDSDDTGTMTLYLQKFDESTKNYVKDQETYDRAIETLAKLGLELDTLETDIFGKELELYYDGERVSVNPIKAFVSFDPISIFDGKRLSDEAIEVKLTLGSEYKNVRFNLGFEIDTEEKGQPVKKNYRVSQLEYVNPDPTQANKIYSLKYTTKAVDSYKKEIEAAKQPEEVLVGLQKVVANTLEREREKTLNAIKEVFNIDLEKFIESPKSYDITAKVKANVLETQEGVVYYLTAKILKVEEVEVVKEN